MSSSAKQEARRAGRSKFAMPEAIPDLPENVAKAILSTSPQKRDEWGFMRLKSSAGKQSSVQD